MLSLFTEVQWDVPSLWILLASISFNPLFWNIVARRENKTQFLSKFIGNKYTACYVLAATIFLLGIFRDYLYAIALKEQTQSLSESWVYLGGLMMVLGNILVLSSMWRLGVTGTYLGDYFGIYMEEKVTAFPFNVLENPMYQGSTMNFLGYALWNQSSTGLLISVYVWFTYQVAIHFEK
ncbi:Phosphatidyl-N-methylethanolamine N-methyltransferase [Coelomomyces lativittatus]|nr:Phosphatidyl-N-methylethanolamine N-methyltransferase [Coelomomyces lativittatus]KAJ1508671.1 Phosphatidyl-N-methylethanolamine N-methyltransferase [Coelomomyces lativittatus]